MEAMTCSVLTEWTIWSVDMCLDDETTDSNELQMNEMCFISPRTNDIASVRYTAQSCRQNLALELGGRLLQSSLYVYLLL